MTKQFAFSDEERAAAREVVKTVVAQFAAIFGVTGLDIEGIDWLSDADFKDIEAAINRARAGDPVLTVRTKGAGGLSKAAVRYKGGWSVCYYDGSTRSYMDGDRYSDVPDILNWPVVYRPEADA